MDNVIHAIFLAFAMFTLVIGLSFSVYLLNNLNSVATALINANDKTRDYQSISYDSKSISTKGNFSSMRTRQVIADTVISTIYRYDKENFSVEIYDKTGKLHQLFDLEVEDVLAAHNEEDDIYKAYNYLYSSDSGAMCICNLFGAPWKSSKEDIKRRIDLYISSQKGYISNTEVDYEGKGFSNLIANGTTFLEQFIQYTYDGETISENNGDDIETITGSRKEQKKIIIRYIQQ